MLFNSYYHKVKNCRTHGFTRLGKPKKCRVCGLPARWEHNGYAGAVCDFHYSEVQKYLETPILMAATTTKDYEKSNFNLEEQEALLTERHKPEKPDKVKP